MNPLTTVSSSNLYESVQRIDASRVSNPTQGSPEAREQDVQRAEQPASGVSTQISDTARARAADDLAATQTVSGSNAASQSEGETREVNEPRGTVGRLVDEQA